MTTQYTPILKLALPVTGELSGTWGDVVNDNITSMIEQAIAGLATISTWSANAHTLSTANGTTSESRCAMLVAQDGAGLAAAGEIICPASSKLYVLKNATSYQLTLKTSGGSGIAVASGETAFLFCDGTNVNACVTTIINGHITGNLTVDGNATVNGNTTLGNATSDTITTTARFASGLIPSADNTYDLGSTANSWKDLYIDGTATMALVAISGGTVNGVSIGATTPATFLAVDNLSLDGNTIASTNTNGNIVIAPNGTGDVQLDADTVRVGDSGAAATLTSNGAGELTVTTGGAANLVLSTNSGTDSGTIQITQGANANIIVAPNGTGDVILSADTTQIGDANTDAYLTTNGTGNLNLTTNNGTNSGTIQIAQGANGNITLTPNGTGSVSISKIYVSGGASFAGGSIAISGTTNPYVSLNDGTRTAYFQLSSGVLDIYSGAATPLQFTVAGTASAGIDTTGRFNIGSGASGISKLNVQGSDSTVGVTGTVGISLQNTNGANGGSGSFIRFYSDTRGNNYMAAIGGLLDGSTATGAYGSIGVYTKLDEASSVPLLRTLVTNTGAFLINTSSNIATAATATTPRFAVADTAKAIGVFSTFANDANPTYLSLQKSRGASVGTLSATADGDTLGYISFEGVGSGNARVLGASVSAAQYGSAGSSYVPSMINLTTSDGTTIADRLRIYPDGTTVIGNPAKYSNRLAVYADNVATPTVSNMQLRVQTGTSNSARMAIGVNGSTAYFIAGGSLTNPDFVWANNDSSAYELMRLNTSAQLLVNTTTALSSYPALRLQVNGTIIAGAGTDGTNGVTAIGTPYAYGSNATFGSLYGGALYIGSGVQALAGANGFASSNSYTNTDRGAYSISAQLHQWWSAGPTTTAIGSAVTMTELMRLYQGVLMLNRTTSTTYDTNGGTNYGGNYPLQISTQSVTASKALAGSGATSGYFAAATQNSSGNAIINGLITMACTSVTPGAETGAMYFGVKSSGTAAVSNTIMRITSDNRVGINTSTVSSDLHVNGTGTSAPLQVGLSNSMRAALGTVYGGPNYGTALYLAMDVGSTQKAWRVMGRYGDGGSLAFSFPSNDQGYGSDPSTLTYVEKMLITSSVVKLTDLQGIQFQATQAASADANTLDDYEEGNFTPGITFGGGNTGMTFSVQTGQYTKVGRIVYIRANFRFSAKGSSTGSAVLTGLPFTSLVMAGGFSGQGLIISGQNGFSSITAPIQLQVNETATNASFFQGFGSLTTLTDANFVGDSSQYFSITGWYATT